MSALRNQSKINSTFAVCVDFGSLSIDEFNHTNDVEIVGPFALSLCTQQNASMLIYFIISLFLFFVVVVVVVRLWLTACVCVCVHEPIFFSPPLLCLRNFGFPCLSRSVSRSHCVGGLLTQRQMRKLHFVRSASLSAERVQCHWTHFHTLVPEMII